MRISDWSSDVCSSDLGGAGYIGSHAVLACRASARPVVILDNLSRGSRRLVPADVPFYEGDAGDPTILAKIFHHHRVEAVMRSEERRVGKGCVSTWRSRWW